MVADHAIYHYWFYVDIHSSILLDACIHHRASGLVPEQYNREESTSMF